MPLATVIRPLVAADVQNNTTLVPIAAALTPVIAAVLISAAKLVVVVLVAVTVVPLITSVVPPVMFGPAMVPVTAGTANCHAADHTCTQALDPGPPLAVATESVPVFFHKRIECAFVPSTFTVTIA